MTRKAVSVWAKSASVSSLGRLIFLVSAVSVVCFVIVWPQFGEFGDLYKKGGRGDFVLFASAIKKSAER